MLDTDTDIQTEVFAELPARYRKRDVTAPWLVVQRRGLKTHSFLEGPCFDASGNLYVTDIPFGRIFRISPDGVFDLAAEYDGEPNGLKIIEDGVAVIADHKQGLIRLDLATGKTETYFDRPLLERFKGLNDLHVATNGDVYFTDQGQSGLQDPSGRVYRLSPDGRLDCLLDGIPSPNGLVLDTAQEHVLLAVTRANQVWRLPLMLDGTTSKVGAFINLSGGVGPDGLAVDYAGNLAVCHPGLGVVWIFSPYGELLRRVRSCAGRMTTNCAYHPVNRNLLYITDSDTGSILRATLPC
jgi:gluconolactonase